MTAQMLWGILTAMEEQRPRIRPGVELLPTLHQGQQVFLLRDRWGISPDLVLKDRGALILSLMDGVNDLRDIQVMLMRRWGLALVGMEELRELIENLDAHFLLDNQRFQLRKKELVQEFRNAAVRLPAHAGSAYPAQPGPLQDYLRALLGAPEASRESLSADPKKPPSGLVLPHIDLERGGSCYAKGYAFLKPFIKEFDLFVILGTCHLPMESPICLTDKTFRTPLGDVRSAQDLVREVCRLAGQDLFAEELVHKVEHSVEIQVVLLQFLAGGTCNSFRILPVLLGGFHRMMEHRELPSSDPELEAGIRALKEVLNNYPGRACIIASADLAHLGPQFGDPGAVSYPELGRAEREDLSMLQWVMKGNPDGFYRHIMAEGDRRRICGLPPIYVWLRVLEGKEVRLIDYAQAHHPQCTVTFASLGAW